MRFADAGVLPYDFTNLADTVKMYSMELKTLVKTLQKDAATRKGNINDGIYKLTADPKKPLNTPELLTSPPDMNFTALDSAITALDAAALKFNQARSSMQQLPPAKLAHLNEELARAERQLLYAQGLPRRPWVTHTLYAPGWLTGYGVKTLPGVREALEEGRYPEAKEQMVIVADAIDKEAAYVDKLATEIGQ